VSSARYDHEPAGQFEKWGYDVHVKNVRRTHGPDGRERRDGNIDNLFAIQPPYVPNGQSSLIVLGTSSTQVWPGARGTGTPNAFTNWVGDPRVERCQVAGMA
jgi:hypothetical protein